jgi:hypothetical protein
METEDLTDCKAEGRAVGRQSVDLTECTAEGRTVGRGCLYKEAACFDQGTGSWVEESEVAAENPGTLD